MEDQKDKYGNTRIELSLSEEDMSWAFRSHMSRKGYKLVSKQSFEVDIEEGVDIDKAISGAVMTEIANEAVQVLMDQEGRKEDETNI